MQYRNLKSTIILVTQTLNSPKTEQKQTKSTYIFKITVLRLKKKLIN